MRKQLTYLLLLTTAILFLLTCKKTINNVHIHGQVLYKCDGKPANNVTFIIGAVYENAGRGPERNDLGNVTPDNNGNYSLVADVSYQGDIYYYDLRDASTSFVYGKQYASNSDKDILLNATISKDENFNIHIKNTNPFDNNDLLDTLKIYLVYDGGYSPTIVLANNLQGQVVDQAIPPVINSDQSTYILEYSFTKNNMRTVKFDTVQTVCYGVTNVNIFY